MRVQVQLRIVAEDESVISDDTELLLLDKTDDRLEALGLSLAEAKTLLAGIQQRLVTAQAASYAARHRGCPLCGRRRRSKGPSPIVFRTAFGTVPLTSPRIHRCGCQPAIPKTFSPLTELFTEHTAPDGRGPVWREPDPCRARIVSPHRPPNRRGEPRTATGASGAGTANGGSTSAPARC